MLELQILAANVLLPTAVLTVTLIVLHYLRRPAALAKTTQANTTPSSKTPSSKTPSSKTPSSKTPSSKTLPSSATEASGALLPPLRLSIAIVVLASAFAIWSAFALRVPDAMAWWPEDAWARLPLAFAMVGLGAILSTWVPERLRFMVWLIRATALWGATKIVIPTGEAWAFLEPSVPIWTLVLVLAPLLGWWLIDGLPSKAAGTLGLSWIPCIAAAAFLSKDFLRVTEPMLAIASVLGCVSLGALLVRQRELLGAIAGPCLFGSGAAVASFQFNSYLGLPDQLSWFAIAAPSVAALATLGYERVPVGAEAGVSPACSPVLSRRQVLLVASACMLVSIVVVVWTIMASGGAGGEDSW